MIGHSQALEALEASAGGPLRGVRSTNVIQLERQVGELANSRGQEDTMFPACIEDGQAGGIPLFPHSFSYK